MIRSNDDLKHRWKSAVQWLGDELERVCVGLLLLILLQAPLSSYRQSRLVTGLVVPSRLVMPKSGFAGVWWMLLFNAYNLVVGPTVRLVTWFSELTNTP